MISVDVSGPAITGLTRSEIQRFVSRCVRWCPSSGQVPGKAGELSIAFVDDSEMELLNRTFRGKRGATDILTFPAGDSLALPGEGSSLGDLVISIPQAKKQARENHHSLSTEIRYLLLHGILHAYGHDHETDQGEMNALELQIRPKVGLV